MYDPCELLESYALMLPCAHHRDRHRRQCSLLARCLVCVEFHVGGENRWLLRQGERLSYKGSAETEPLRRSVTGKASLFRRRTNSSEVKKRKEEN